jgi:hypothetical protein
LCFDLGWVPGDLVIEFQQTFVLTPRQVAHDLGDSMGLIVQRLGLCATHRGNTTGYRYSVCAEQTAQWVTQRSALFDQPATYPVHGLLGLLCGAFDRYSTYGAVIRRFGYRLGIVVVVLLPPANSP